MSAKVWNGPYDRVFLPDATNGTNSRPFSVPKGARAATIFIPDLVGVGTTVLIQSLQPPLQENETEVWVNISVFDLTDGSFEVLDALVESTCVTLPVTALGTGVLRFVASAAQTGAADALEIRVLWAMEE